MVPGPFFNGPWALALALDPPGPPLAAPAHDDLLLTCMLNMYVEHALLAHVRLLHATHVAAPCASAEGRFVWEKMEIKSFAKWPPVGQNSKSWNALAPVF